MGQEYDWSELESPGQQYDWSELESPQKSWGDWITEDVLTGGNALRYGIPAVGGLIGYLGAPLTMGGSLALAFGSGAAGEAAGRWYEGKDFDPVISGVEGALNLIPAKKLIPGSGILSRMGQHAATGLWQGAAGSVPRHLAEEGTLLSPSEWTLPSAERVGTEAAGGAFFNTAIGGGFEGASALRGRRGVPPPVVESVPPPPPGANPPPPGNWDVGLGGGRDYGNVTPPLMEGPEIGPYGMVRDPIYGQQDLGFNDPTQGDLLAGGIYRGPGGRMTKTGPALPPKMGPPVGEVPPQMGMPPTQQPIDFNTQSNLDQPNLFSPEPPPPPNVPPPNAPIAPPTGPAPNPVPGVIFMQGGDVAVIVSPNATSGSMLRDQGYISAYPMTGPNGEVLMVRGKDKAAYMTGDKKFPPVPKTPPVAPPQTRPDIPGAIGPGQAPLTGGPVAIPKAKVTKTLVDAMAENGYVPKRDDGTTVIFEKDPNAIEAARSFGDDQNPPQVGEETGRVALFDPTARTPTPRTGPIPPVRGMGNKTFEEFLAINRVTRTEFEMLPEGSKQMVRRKYRDWVGPVDPIEARRRDIEERDMRGETPRDLYRLPDGKIISVDATATKGVESFEFGREGGPVATYMRPRGPGDRIGPDGYVIESNVTRPPSFSAQPVVQGPQVTGEPRLTGLGPMGEGVRPNRPVVPGMSIPPSAGPGLDVGALRQPSLFGIDPRANSVTTPDMVPRLTQELGEELDFNTAQKATDFWSDKYTEGDAGVEPLADVSLKREREIRSADLRGAESPHKIVPLPNGQYEVRTVVGDPVARVPTLKEAELVLRERDMGTAVPGMDTPRVMHGQMDLPWSYGEGPVRSPEDVAGPAAERLIDRGVPPEPTQQSMMGDFMDAEIGAGLREQGIDPTGRHGRIDEAGVDDSHITAVTDLEEALINIQKLDDSDPLKEVAINHFRQLRSAQMGPEFGPKVKEQTGYPPDFVPEEAGKRGFTSGRSRGGKKLREQLNKAQKFHEAMITLPVKGTTREPVIHDMGGKLTPEEMQLITRSPTTQELIKATDEIINTILQATGRQEWINRVTRAGLVLDNRMYGVHVPNPETGASAILMNHFARMSEGNTPKLAAWLNTVTSAHEVAHVGHENVPEARISEADLADPRVGDWLRSFMKEIQSYEDPKSSGHALDFSRRLGEIHAKLGVARTFDIAAKLERIYTRGSKSGSYSPEIQRILQLYSESRRRIATTEDYLRGTWSKSASRGSDTEKRLPGNSEANGDGIATQVDAAFNRDNDNPVVAAFRAGMRKMSKFSGTHFILPDGERLNHGQAIHEFGARKVGSSVKEALASGIVRFADDGAEAGSRITYAQAEQLQDAIAQRSFVRYGGSSFFMEVMKPNGERTYKEFNEKATAAAIRNWVNSHFPAEDVPQMARVSPRDLWNRFLGRNARSPEAQAMYEQTMKDFQEADTPEKLQAMFARHRRELVEHGQRMSEDIRNKADEVLRELAATDPATERKLRLTRPDLFKNEPEMAAVDPNDTSTWRRIKEGAGWGQGNEPKPTVAGKKKAQEINYVKEMLALPTGATTTMDFSAPGRNGLSMILTKEFWKATGAMFKGLSKEGFDLIDADLRSKPIFQKKIDFETGQVGKSTAEEIGMKLFRPASDAPIGQRAENVASRWLETGGNIPYASAFYKHTAGVPIRMSNRAYITFLNHLNANRTEFLLNKARDMAIQGVDTGKVRKGLMPWKTKVSQQEAMEMNPYTNLKLGKEIADFVNTATGHGPLKTHLWPHRSGEVSLESAAGALSYVMFSQGQLASRIRMLNPSTYIMASPMVRKQYVKAALSQAAAWAGFSMLAKMGGAEVGDDPTSADFGKVRIGDTRIDPGAGFLQFMVLYSRMYSGGYTSSATGEFHRFGEGFQAETQMSNIMRFGSNKLNPVFKFAYDVLNQSEYNPTHVYDRTAQLFVPLFVQDIVDVTAKNPELVPWLGPMMFGVGAQTYSKGESIGKLVNPENDWLATGGGIADLAPDYIHPRLEY